MKQDPIKCTYTVRKTDTDRWRNRCNSGYDGSNVDDMTVIVGIVLVRMMATRMMTFTINGCTKTKSGLNEAFTEFHACQLMVEEGVQAGSFAMADRHASRHLKWTPYELSNQHTQCMCNSRYVTLLGNIGMQQTCQLACRVCLIRQTLFPRTHRRAARGAHEAVQRIQ